MNQFDKKAIVSCGRYVLPIKEAPSQHAGPVDACRRSPTGQNTISKSSTASEYTSEGNTTNRRFAPRQRRDAQVRVSRRELQHVARRLLIIFPSGRRFPAAAPS